MSIFSKLSIQPDKVKAGDAEEFIISLKAGKDFSETDSRIVFDFSSTLGTSCPTRQVNEAPGYSEAYISNPDVEYSLRVWDLDKKHFVDREHAQSREASRMVVLDISPGIRDGDIIELHWGETLGGFGPGAKVTSLVPRPGYRARIDVRYFSSSANGMPDYGRSFEGYNRPVPDHVERLEYTVLPRELRRARLIRKTSMALLLPFDVFWNMVDTKPNDFSADSEGEKNYFGAMEYKNKNVNIKSEKVPMTESATMDNVFEGKNIYWGDLHTHSMYSCDCYRRSAMDMEPGDLMDFARFRSALDFFAVSDHHQPWDNPENHIGRERWEQTLEDVRSKSKDGEFVVFPGLEFRAERSDTVVTFNGFPSYGEITNPEIVNVKALWQKIKSCDFMTIPHFHGPGSLPEGTWYYPEDPTLEPALEIYSDHGSYEREKVFENGRAWCKAFRFDRCAEFFLQNGYKYAFAANSDDHKGHVGVNGITAVYAENLSRDALFDAYRKRHVYASTNARIRLLFTANGNLMGSNIQNTGFKEFFIDATGENDIKKVEIFRNGSLYRMFRGSGRRFTETVKIENSEPDNWYVRVTQLDNHIAWSSPVWFE